MFDGLVPDLAPRLLVAIGGVAVAFLVLIVVLLFLRRRNSPLFIKGGRAREHRLLVMDAAAVDAKRRLVLIRRDNVEHLVMIGGPTDIVIETGIGSRQKNAGDEVAVVPARAAADKPVAPSPLEAATPVRAAPAQQMRQSPGRPAARVADIDPSQTAAVSAMGSMLYDDSREPLMGGKTLSPEADRGKARGSAQRPDPVAVEAENVLDQARGRVLSAPALREKAVDRDNTIRALEEQLDVSRTEAARAEAARVEATRIEAERVAAAKADAERAEAVRAEAARLEAARLEAQKAEAARLEAERTEKARLEAERVEAERQHAAKIEAERAETARAEAARMESERIAAARAEAMARFEAARRAQMEQRQVAQPKVAQQHWPVIEPPVAEPAQAREEQVALLDDAGNGSQERLASDFEKLLEAELEADGVLDRNPVVSASGEPRDPAGGVPAVNPAQRDTLPITGAVPGISIEQDMARRLGEITLNKKTDAL